MIRIMLEKKDYDTKIRSFDTEFSCGSFYDIFAYLFYFLMSFFKVKILENGCSSPTLLKYDKHKTEPQESYAQNDLKIIS